MQAAPRWQRQKWSSAGPAIWHWCEAGGRGRPWPVPFDIAPVLAQRGRRVAVLASGDPFWFGAGGTLAAALAPGEWRAFPAPGTLTLAAARLGWRLEEVVALGLHAAPFPRLRPHLVRGCRIIATLRDGDAPAALAAWLMRQGAGSAKLTVLERLGGPRRTHPRDPCRRLRPDLHRPGRRRHRRR